MAHTRRIELWQGQDERWRFHVRAPNGRITETSQTYASRRGARRAAQRFVPGVPIVLVEP